MGKLAMSFYLWLDKIDTSCLSLGDAGYILFGPIGREVLSAGTIIFAIFAAVRSSSLTLSFLFHSDGLTGLSITIGSTGAVDTI